MLTVAHLSKYRKLIGHIVYSFLTATTHHNHFATCGLDFLECVTLKIFLILLRSTSRKRTREPFISLVQYL
jgi:hypothetical protein